MNIKNLIVIFLLIAVTLLSGCSVLSLKAPPIEESNQVKLLLSSSKSALIPDNLGRFPFNHTWSSETCVAEPSTPIYVNPVDTSRVDETMLSKSNLSREDLSELAEYARRRIVGAFAERNEKFQVVDRKPSHGRVVEISVVELTGTEVARNLIGTALGAFVPGGGLVAFHSSGTISVEGVVKEAETGAPLFVFADRERGKTALFSFNDFRPLSHARDAIDDWSTQLVASCAAAPGTRIGDRATVTLLPL